MGINAGSMLTNDLIIIRSIEIGNLSHNVYINNAQDVSVLSVSS